MRLDSNEVAGDIDPAHLIRHAVIGVEFTDAANIARPESGLFGKFVARGLVECRSLLDAPARKFQALPVREITVLINHDEGIRSDEGDDHARSQHVDEVILALLARREKNVFPPVRPPGVLQFEGATEAFPGAESHEDAGAGCPVNRSIPNRDA